jgi:hypothetical protein
MIYFDSQHWYHYDSGFFDNYQPKSGSVLKYLSTDRFVSVLSNKAFYLLSNSFFHQYMEELLQNQDKTKIHLSCSEESITVNLSEFLQICSMCVHQSTIE